MYCERCEMNHFGGSRCPACGDPMKRGEVRFMITGEPLRKAPGEAALGQQYVPYKKGKKDKEPGRSEALAVRISYKFLESVFACVFFSVMLRVVIFLVKVIDSLMETGGDIKEGISFAEDIQRAISWYEIAAWVFIVLLVFKYRHGPR